jgi:hypothetical protein
VSCRRGFLIPRSSFSVTIERAESHSARSDLSAVEAETTPEGLRCGLLFLATNTILMPREAASMRSPGRWTAGAVVWTHQALRAAQPRQRATQITSYSTALLMLALPWACLGFATSTQFRPDWYPHCPPSSSARCRLAGFLFPICGFAFLEMI